MSLDQIAVILTSILTLLAIFGVRYVQKIVTALKESGDVGIALGKASEKIDTAIADNIVTAGELKEIDALLKQVKKELDQAKKAWQNIFKKGSA